MDTFDAMQTVNIAGYTRSIEQPSLVSDNGDAVCCKIGDPRLQLADSDLKDMGAEAAFITGLLQKCAASSNENWHDPMATSTQTGVAVLHAV
jgi:hypothetical protein